MRVELCVSLLALLLTGEAAATEQPPDVELLEFLGEFTTDDGEWVDPMSFDRDAADDESAAPEPEVRHEDLEDRR